MVTLGAVGDLDEARWFGDHEYVPRAGLRPPRVFRQRRRVAVLTQQGWDTGSGPEEGDGLAGVREPRRPSPVPPSMMAALPLPEDESVG